MGSNPSHGGFLQALLIKLVERIIALVVRIILHVLCAVWASLWASLKERIAHPATGYWDLETGPPNIGAGATIPVMALFCEIKIGLQPIRTRKAGTDNPNGLPVNSGVGDGGKLEHTEDMAGTRASTSEAQIPTPKAQCKNVTEDGNGRACGGGGCFTQ